VVFDSYEKEDGTRKSQYGNSMDPPNNDVDFVVRKNDIHTISNKTFDFSTIRELILHGYQEIKEVMKKVVAENA
jgi:hypothetical protein